LQMVLQKQEQVLQQYGPGNPLVTVGQYRNTLAKFIEAAGFKDADQFMNQITPEVEAQLAAPKPPPPDSQAEFAKMMAQVEQEKAQVAREKNQAMSQIDAAKLQLDRQNLEASYAQKGVEMAMKNQKDQQELKLKEAELAVKQLQAILAMDIADEDSRTRQADIVLKAIKEIGNITR